MNNDKKQEQNNDEEIKEEGEVMQTAYEFTPNAMCQYRQRGPYLVCTSCDLQHAVHIGMNAMMIGVDASGNPIIKKRLV